VSFVKFETAIGETQTHVKREDKTMLELQGDTLKFSFPEVHPDAELTITFVRTLRIPDDDKTYPLPPGLGSFPLQHVDDHRERVPAKWLEHGGVMLPMFQCEALWIKFSSKHIPKRRTQYPFAVKIGTGKISAITGDEWVKVMREEDYCVVPEQPWIDGYKIDEENIRQFVAAPLGWGFTAEEQLTGKAEHGGIQIEVYPMDFATFDKKFPKIKPREVKTSGVLRGGGGMGPGFPGSIYAPPGVYTATLCLNDSVPVGAEMGIGAGGKMKQQIFKDPHGMDVWQRSQKARCFVHLANSMAWEAITGKKPPATPVTADVYTSRGYPWFDYYDESREALEGTEKLAGLKSIMKMGFQKGMNILPENTSVDPSDQVYVIKGKAGEVRVGAW
jgi:hypothetical protein